MRRRSLKQLWKRLKELQQQSLNPDDLLLKVRSARRDAGRNYDGLVSIQLPPEGKPANTETFQFSLRKDKLRQARRREGCYLLRSNLTEADPATFHGRQYAPPRYTLRAIDQLLLLQQLKLTLPQPPRIRVNPTSTATASANAV